MWASGLSPTQEAPLPGYGPNLPCARVSSTHHQCRAAQTEPGDINTSAAAVQDVSHLPTTSKGCLEGRIGRLPSWPALPPSEGNARVTRRSFRCGPGTASDSRAPGLPRTTGPQTPDSSQSPPPPHRCAPSSPPDGALCSLPLRAKLLETVVLLLLCLSVLTPLQPGLCP